ncbi:MAG: hypothetical protein FWC60_05365 [Firmicutes bacterium]|nr:hypothetical protein [Bacillota bacterium]
MALEEFLDAHPELPEHIWHKILGMDNMQITFPDRNASNLASDEIIETLKSIVPQCYIKPNNKLAREMPRELLNAGSVDLVIRRGSTKIKEIVTKVSLAYEDNNISLSGRAEFTAYDSEVQDGVITLWEAGNKAFTPAMVYRAMNGMEETEKVGKQALRAVTQSIEKCRRIFVKIDVSQEAQLYKKALPKVVMDGYLLECRGVNIMMGGHTQNGYRLLAKPLLYEYAQISGQVISAPYQLMQTKGAVRATEEVIVIRGHLLRRVEDMKCGTFNSNNKIAFEGIYNALRITPGNCGAEAKTQEGKESAYRKKTAIIRQHVSAILNEWQNQGYIKGHVQYKIGKIIKGITIAL